MLQRFAQWWSRGDPPHPGSALATDGQRRLQEKRNRAITWLQTESRRGWVLSDKQHRITPRQR